MDRPRRRAAQAQPRRPDTYKVDLEGGALYRNGRRVPLQEQPFKLLASLMARPGEIVSRETLQADLWGAHPPIDRDQGLNTAIGKLRAAFRDSAEHPRFIERVPRRGYRYIGPALEPDLPPAPPPGLQTGPEVVEGTPAKVRRGPGPGLAWACAGLLALALAAALTVRMPARPHIHPHGRPPKGIGGWDLMSTQDRGFAFDYDHSGKLDHLVFYRPGTPRFWIIGRDGDGFWPVYNGNDLEDNLPRAGTDRILAFDYAHSGKQDYLMVYRPGAGVLRIFRNDGPGLFTPVYSAPTPPRGAAKDAGTQGDQAFAFDYDHSGKLDHLLVYRSGVGIAGIWTNQAGRWAPVRAAGAGGGRAWPSGQAFAFDYDHSGRLDHLAVFDPASHGLTVLANAGGAFAPVFAAGGVSGFGQVSANDRALAVADDRSGKLDRILIYRPGAGLAEILAHAGGRFSPIYSGHGLAGYDLMSPQDQALPLDFDGSGKPDRLVLYRPGAGLAQLVRLP